MMKQAIIAIEDRRFYTNAGIDLRGIGRALYQDIRAQEAVQGGSTITMQFVKNALAAQDERTLFNKLREAALAYQITRKWSKERILRNYLNTIYFGNGAYGIEAAARTYFGTNHPGCGEDARPALRPAARARRGGAARRHRRLAERATTRSTHREAAGRRRALVLQRMVEQGYITPAQRDEALLDVAADQQGHPAAGRGHALPVLHVVGQAAGRRQARRRPGGRAARRSRAGLTVQTTLDVAPPGRRRERGRGSGCRTQGGPRASLVAIKNDTGEVLAMVGGDDYATAPVQPRHPGPAPARLGVQAVRARAGARQRHLARLDLGVAQDVALRHAHKKGKCTEAFEVNNYEDAYAGVRTLRTRDDVLRQRRLRAGRHQGRHAQDRPARAPDGHPHAVSHNFAMTLGGLERGRHAARHGARLRDVRPGAGASPTAR